MSGRPLADADLERVWGAALGVRRPWRRRGLGKALFLHSFREFHRLYETVGMHVELEQVVYEKELA